MTPSSHNAKHEPTKVSHRAAILLYRSQWLIPSLAGSWMSYPLADRCRRQGQLGTLNNQHHVVLFFQLAEMQGACRVVGAGVAAATPRADPTH